MTDSSTVPTAESLRLPLAFSVAMHATLVGLLVLSSLLSHRGELWGGPGAGVITVGLVGSVPGVPLPRPDVVTTSRVVDPTRGLYKSEATPKPPETMATPLPEFSRNKRPRIISRPSRVLENPAPTPPNAVPYGEGGAPSLPYASFTMGAGTQGGLGLTGAGGDGNFGNRFPWYVEAVQRRISGNWLQSTVDATVQWAPRVVVTFQILRDGTVTNIQILRSSGNASVDLSAVRAIRDSSPLDRLPAGYGGSFVNVEFWFDFRR